MIKLRSAQRLSLMIVMASFGLAFWAWPQMPYEIASHWNAAGQVDGYMPRFWGVFLMPAISLIMWIMLLVLPKMDPRSVNIEKFQAAFDRMILGLFVFLLSCLCCGFLRGVVLCWSPFACVIAFFCEKYCRHCAGLVQPSVMLASLAGASRKI